MNLSNWAIFHNIYYFFHLIWFDCFIILFYRWFQHISSIGFAITTANVWKIIIWIIHECQLHLDRLNYVIAMPGSNKSITIFMNHVDNKWHISHTSENKFMKLNGKRKKRNFYVQLSRSPIKTLCCTMKNPLINDMLSILVVLRFVTTSDMRRHKQTIAVTISFYLTTQLSCVSE